MASPERVPAEVFAPGEFIQEELEVRGWTQSDLAEIMGRDAALVSGLATGKRAVSPETARGLGDAFGTGAAFWLNLESSYQLAKVDRDDSTARRSNLYSRAPIQHMVRRGWLGATETVDDLEVAYKGFYGVADVCDSIAPLAHAARKASDYNSVTQEEMAWLYRAAHMARLVDAPKYSAQRLDRALGQLRDLLTAPEETRKVASILREAGVRFVVIENLPKTRIDGACIWLNKSTPVVAMSLRFDRIDWFWHTLIHELTHVRHRDGAVVDTEMDKSRSEEDRPEEEKRADASAVSFLVPQDQLTGFMMRVQPFYSKKKIRGFAARVGVHPGLVVGQLQFRRQVGYAHNREMLVKVREIVTSTALADGWGDVSPT